MIEVLTAEREMGAGKRVLGRDGGMKMQPGRGEATCSPQPPMPRASVLSPARQQGQGELNEPRNASTAG